MSNAAPIPHACNVLSLRNGERHLYHFAVNKSSAVPAGQWEVAADKPLPANVVLRDWRLLIRSRLDIAWMPPESVFLRAVQLPACAPAELAGMIEFQLEKLSPMPPAQVVWTVESVAHPDATQQTALVTIAARSAVEAFVEKLEQGGYMADRIELPMVRRLLAKPVQGELLRIVLDGSGAQQVALLGWWTDSVLRDVSMIRLPVQGAAQLLLAQLNGTAWAAELDGWLAALPPVTVVAAEAEADPLLEALQGWCARPVSVEPPGAEPDLARLTASHALQPSPASLIPEEVRTRQRGQYVDSLWVKGLTALAMTYLAGVFVYLAVLTYQKSAVETLQGETRSMALQYTNTLQLKARVRVLQEQVALRFAALDCWNAVVEKLPEALTLVQLDFKNGRILLISGNASEGDRAEVTRYNDLLRAVTSEGKPLFSEVKPATMTPRGPLLVWSFEAELRREEGVSP
ncbi:MAG: hypothetical protein EXS21_06415 [Pedosphaera sp.]|nr:hypothetical protein [Pedosphaera sp.]